MRAPAEIAVQRGSQPVARLSAGASFAHPSHDGRDGPERAEHQEEPPVGDHRDADPGEQGQRTRDHGEPGTAAGRGVDRQGTGGVRLLRGDARGRLLLPGPGRRASRRSRQVHPEPAETATAVQPHPVPGTEAGPGGKDLKPGVVEQQGEVRSGGGGAARGQQDRPVVLEDDVAASPGQNEAGARTGTLHDLDRRRVLLVTRRLGCRVGGSGRLRAQRAEQPVGSLRPSRGGVFPVVRHGKQHHRGAVHQRGGPDRQPCQIETLDRGAVLGAHEPGELGGQVRAVAGGGGGDGRGVGGASPAPDDVQGQVHGGSTPCGGAGRPVRPCRGGPGASTPFATSGCAVSSTCGRPRTVTSRPRVTGHAAAASVPRAPSRA